MKQRGTIVLTGLALLAGVAGCGPISIQDLEADIVNRENECKQIETEGDGVAPHVRAYQFSADSAFERGFTQGQVQGAEEEYERKRRAYGCDELHKDKQILILRKQQQGTSR